MPRGKPTPVTYKGVDYPSFQAVDRAHGWYLGRFIRAHRSGTEDLIGRPQGGGIAVTIGDTTYESYSAAGRALGYPPNYIRTCALEGRLDRLGEHPRAGTKKARKKLAK